MGHFIWTLSCVSVTSMKHLYWSSWSILKVTIIQYMLCDCIVCIEIGGADDDERKELINSLSGSHDVHLDGNPQGTAWVTRGCGSGATTASPTCVCTVQRDAYVFKFCSGLSYPIFTVWLLHCIHLQCTVKPNLEQHSFQGQHSYLYIVCCDDSSNHQFSLAEGDGQLLQK